MVFSTSLFTGLALATTVAAQGNPLPPLGPWAFYRYDIGNAASCPHKIPELTKTSAVAVRWRFQSGAAIRSSPCMNGLNQVFFGSDDFNVYSLDEATGEQLWAYETKGEVRSSCQVEGIGSGISTVYIRSDDVPFTLSTPFLAETSYHPFWHRQGRKSLRPRSCVTTSRSAAPLFL
jgi:hypothetical protein